MNLVVLSNNLKVLEVEKVDSSSSKFELEFVKNMGNIPGNEIRIISIAYEKETITEGNISLIGSKRGKRLSCMLFFLTRLRQLGGGKDKYLIVFGYDLLSVIFAALAKYIFRYKTIDYIFDSHKAAIANILGLKRLLADAYFNLAIWMVNLFDGFIVFNKEAITILKIKKPFLLSRPGFTFIRIDTPAIKNNDSFVITYAGTLISYNGLETLLSAFSQINSRKVRLEVFGSGPLQEYIQTYAKKDNRVKVNGRINNKDLLIRLQESDLLINLREIDNDINSFAFPSKLLEYISCSIPVLTTDFGLADGILENTYHISELNPQEVAEAINRAMNDGEDTKKQKTDGALRYIQENHNWGDICKETFEFIQGI